MGEGALPPDKHSRATLKKPSPFPIRKEKKANEEKQRERKEAEMLCRRNNGENDLKDIKKQEHKK